MDRALIFKKDQRGLMASVGSNPTPSTKLDCFSLTRLLDDVKLNIQDLNKLTEAT